MMISKYMPSRNRLFLIALLPILALVGYIGVKIHRAPGSPGKPVEFSYADHTVARGLRIEGHVAGQRVYSIDIGRLGVMGKKAGFFRLGFFKVARLDNVVINCYQGSAVSKASQDGNPARSVVPDSAVPDFAGFLAGNDKLKRLIPKRIRGVECSPITINLLQDGTVTSSIRADKATLGPRGRRVVFEGRVRITSGKGKVLECGKITWFADTRRFKTAETYVLKAQERQVRGEGLETDFKLDKVLLTQRRTG